jgi:hypothetical protein
MASRILFVMPLVMSSGLNFKDTLMIYNKVDCLAPSACDPFCSIRVSLRQLRLRKDDHQRPFLSLYRNLAAIVRLTTFRQHLPITIMDFLSIFFTIL